MFFENIGHIDCKIATFEVKDKDFEVKQGQKTFNPLGLKLLYYIQLNFSYYRSPGSGSVLCAKLLLFLEDFLWQMLYFVNIFKDFLFYQMKK
jgi:hypothetical protein